MMGIPRASEAEHMIMVAASEGGFMAYDMVSPSLIHAIERDFRNEKFTDDDVKEHMDWAHDAEKWAEAQIAFGSASDFVRDVIAKRTRYGSLTNGQYRALMNCVRAEVLAAERTAEQLIEQLTTGKEPLNLRSLPSGHYAVIGADDKPVFYHIDNVTADKDRFGGPNKWKDWVFVNERLGGGNRIKIGSQRPGQNYQGQHEGNLRKILEDPLTATMLYGQAIGECGICGRDLTEELSRFAGIGPVCAAKFGIDREELYKKALLMTVKILKKEDANA